MTHSKYTKQGLPIVSEATYDSIFAIFSKGSVEEALVENLLQENPVVYRALEDVLKASHDDMHHGIILGIGFVYELLRRQAEANQLETELEK